MKKLERLSQGVANVRESMGDFREASSTRPPSPREIPAHMQGVSRDNKASFIEVGRIVRDEGQPREEFDPEALERLAESLRTRGQLQPIRVRWDQVLSSYVIVVGERRWRAAKMAGIEKLSCIVANGHDDPDETLEDQLVENALREDLRPVEQARAYRRLMDSKGWVTRDIAKRLSISHTQVSRALALLELPVPVQESVDAGQLAPSAAYEVSKLPSPAAQEALAEAAVDGRMTRAEVAEAVKAVKAKRPAPAPKAPRPDPVSFDVGDAIVSVKWKRESPLTAVQALRKAVKDAADAGRPREDEDSEAA